ncbi:MAG: PEP-CTERM sorting domain-containing protein [Myxococcota bacterium]
MSRFPRLAATLATACAAFGAMAPETATAQDVDLHTLRWFVHVDLIDAGAGRDLAFWEAAIDQATTTGNKLLEGGQGPFDNICCTRMNRTVSVATFGTPGDGLDIIDSAAETAAIDALAVPSSNAYLVDSITNCGGSPAVGCAETPFCDGNGNDDPNRWLIVTVDSFESGTLGTVLAHERGHNACLNHVAANACQIMQATVTNPGLGGCFTASECTNMQAGRTTTSSGLTCGCHTLAGANEPDGTACTDVASGVCSGGVCGVSTGDAAVQLITSAATGSASSSGTTDDAVRISALPADWTELGPFAATSEEIKGMAYAFDSDVLYGVVPTAADDAIVTLDKTTGAILATVGAIANGADEITSMAYDPGATSATTDDRLIVLEVGGSSEFRSIDPASPSTATFLGSLLVGPATEFRGLAYDSIQDKLFMSSNFGPDGLWEVDIANCPPSPCNIAQVSGAGLFRAQAGLAYSPVSGRLYMVGTGFGGTRTFVQSIDTTTFASPEVYNVDPFFPGALAALPEPSTASGVLAGAGLLLALARRRRGTP